MSELRSQSDSVSASVCHAPRDTGLLNVSGQDGELLFEIESPGLGALLRKEIPGLIAFLAFWGALLGLGILPMNWTSAWIAGGFVALAGVAMTMDYYKESMFRLELRASHGRLEVVSEAGGLWQTTTQFGGEPGSVAITEQPIDLYCQNLRPRRLPLIPRKLVIFTGDMRVETGQRLSYDELSFLYESLRETTGWHEVRRTRPLALVTGTLACLVAGAGIGYQFGHLAFERGITPSVWQGQCAVGLMAALLIWGAFLILLDRPGRGAASDPPPHG